MLKGDAGIPYPLSFLWGEEFAFVIQSSFFSHQKIFLFTGEMQCVRVSLKQTAKARLDV